MDLLVKYCRPRLFSFFTLLVTCAIFLTVITWQSPILLLCILLGSLAVLVIQQVGSQVNLSKRTLMLLQILTVGLILSFFWVDYFSDPVMAQFFGKAETFFKTTLTQGSTQNNSAPAISLVFNVLRALYLLYIAVSLIGVINAVRKDDDWQVVARTPLLVVIAVTVADVLTGFITG
ncbi:MAG: hypothetical protein KME60_16545 [Cyanomargarita calcarea GSE-NOS-MK-12-04C]|jgi:ABC-type multidrug transport system permease subunit|uniref:Uncharacterized protein n=1 Tax=Cyanomargarita calcarea GSE-NOS-MK-12-04C TaxID=2839659 RepID=A0A951UTQ3_9CYAN|nr:hypothetical protein [Cyanomargarita calcarea GSE-NOS-MK-12-04C]